MNAWARFGAWLGALFVAALVPPAVGIGNVPDPVASHWGANGQPDGSLPAWSLFVLPLGVMAIGTFLALLLRSDGKPTPEATAVSGLVGGVAISLSAISVVLNWNAEEYTDAGSFGWWQFALVLATGAGLGVLGYVIGKRWFPVPPRAPLSVPVMEPLPRETTWSSTITVRWVTLVLLPFAGFFLFLDGWLKLIALFYVVLIILFSKVGVVVDRNGLKVNLADRLTVKSIGVDSIESVAEIDLEPREWAGWGYRVVPNGSAVVLRRGPAIEVVKTDGRKFAVTIDDAATGAVVLAGHVARVRS